MAISKDKWLDIKFLFENGKALKEIELETGVNRGTISKKAKKCNWEKKKTQPLKNDIKEYEEKKATLEAKKGNLIDKIATLEDFEITRLSNIVEDEIGIKSALFSTTMLSTIRKNQLLTKNTKQVIEMETIYSDEGKPLKKSPVRVDIELGPNDLKALDEGIDKNAVTLEIAPRHSNSQVTVNNTNAQQNNINKEIVTETLESFDDEY